MPYLLRGMSGRLVWELVLFVGGVCRCPRPVLPQHACSQQFGSDRLHDGAIETFRQAIFSELSGTMGTCLMSVFPRMSAKTAEIYSPALFDTSRSGGRPKVASILVKNGLMTGGVSDRFVSGRTCAYRELISMKDVNYLLKPLGIPEIFNGPMMSVHTAAPRRYWWYFRLCAARLVLPLQNAWHVISSVVVDILLRDGMFRLWFRPN